MQRRWFSTETVRQVVQQAYPVARRGVPKLHSHSHPTVHSYSSALRVHVVPVLEDSYSYILECPRTKKAALVDPTEPELVLQTAEKAGLHVEMVLSTSHVPEQCRGNAVVASKRAKIPIIGCDPRIPSLTRKAVHGETLRVGALRVRVLSTPLSTQQAGSFHVLAARDYRGITEARSPNRNPHSVLFSGHALSLGGCGPFQEVSEQEAFRTLVLTLGSLPSDTEVYSAKEVSVRNLEFASQLLPTEDDVQKALQAARAKREQYLPTVPFFLEDEFFVNPFMRLNHGAVYQSVECNMKAPPREVLKKLFQRRGY